MKFLIKISSLLLLLQMKAFCQYANYEYDDDYEPDEEYPQRFHVNQNFDYAIPYLSSLDCARECFCPSSLPQIMYCENRKLKSIPKIPAHIQQLYLQFNEIEGVPATAFINATSLKEINLSHNKIKSDRLEDGVFTKLTKLTQLFLDHNKLEEFPSLLPNSLERLLLNFNQISKIQARNLQGLIHVTMLDLCNNRIEDAFKGKALSKMRNLMQLNLCNNKLRSMPQSPPESLMYLSLENNSISHIPEDYFTKLRNLTAVRMSHNNVQEIPRNMFNLPKLMELDLSSNKLKQAFYIPRSLEHLYLQDNEFEFINITLMCSFIDPMNPNRLTYIRVDKNRLKAPLSTFAFLCFPHIHSIYYGEQKKGEGQNTQLEIPSFPQFPEPEEDRDEGPEEGPYYHGEVEHREREDGEDGDFEPYSY
ncbi:osteomodulin [Ambystoma mexicanum]|uniref:osteomodulin n=1 Tax=Ambystoma mexicanum TaxID=8296 RepID=UPI0037E9B4E9